MAEHAGPSHGLYDGGAQMHSDSASVALVLHDTKPPRGLVERWVKTDHTVEHCYDWVLTHHTNASEPKDWFRTSICGIELIRGGETPIPKHSQ